jgi:hypothetical protein
MYKNNSLWLRFGCFLTGYNYSILKSCSEASRKQVKKYTAALLIIMLIWFIIGYLFAREYLKLDLIGSIIAGIISVFVIVQIERQIILGSKSYKAQAARFIIGIVMAVIGSVIVDQIIFSEDLEKRKIFAVNEEVESLLPQRTAELKTQMRYVDSLIAAKEMERKDLLIEITENPTITMPSSSVRKIPKTIEREVLVDGVIQKVKKDTVVTERSYSTGTVPNPKADLVPVLDNQLSDLNEQKNTISQRLIDSKENLTEELLDIKGFLDELQLMIGILTGSVVSLLFWILLFVLFLFIELLVLINKSVDGDTDYDKMIQHQQTVRIQAIEKLVETKIVS